MKDLKAEHISVFGKVQGVFYRKSTLNKAVQVGLKGWVENKADGSVEIWAEGSAMQIEELKAWCKTGPPHAKVSELISKSMAVQFYKSFEIEYSH